VFLSARLGVSGCRKRIFGLFNYFRAAFHSPAHRLSHAESGATPPLSGQFSCLVSIVVSTLVLGTNTVILYVLSYVA
jgi:hypothetical protein